MTKIDLENERKISEEQGRALAKQMKMPYFETSAKEGINVDKMFNKVIRYTIDGEIQRTP